MKKNERQSCCDDAKCDIYKLIPKIKLIIETPVLKRKRSEQTFTLDLTDLNKASENTQIFS